MVAVGYKVAVLGERLPLEQISSRRCPTTLRELVRRCWEADPYRRPAAAELAKELLALREQVGLARAGLVRVGGAGHKETPPVCPVVTILRKPSDRQDMPLVRSVLFCSVLAVAPLPMSVRAICNAR